jgi:hypothetical protein
MRRTYGRSGRFGANSSHQQRFDSASGGAHQYELKSRLCDRNRYLHLHGYRRRYAFPTAGSEIFQPFSHRRRRNYIASAQCREHSCAHICHIDGGLCRCLSQRYGERPRGRIDVLFSWVRYCCTGVWSSGAQRGKRDPGWRLMLRLRGGGGFYCNWIIDQYSSAGGSSNQSWRQCSYSNCGFVRHPK